MGETTVSPDELLDLLEALDVSLPDEATTAYADLGQRLNLNAVAIGLGLDAVAYEPDRFSGLVYRPGAYDPTVVVLFANGTLFVDGAPSVDAREIVSDVTDRLVEMELVDERGPTPKISRSPSEVPVPTEATEAAVDGTDGERTTMGPDPCANCGRKLTGAENFCPGCGEQLRPRCPSCGDGLAGSENYCPACGVGLATD